MTPYPFGMGTAKPVRMGTRPAFASISMSSAFGEKSPTITFASLESHKIGGIVRLIPLTGITLPFISYGGSSVVANFILLAVLMLVSQRANEPA